MMVSDVLQGSPQSEEVDEESDDIPLLTIRERLQSLAIVKRILDQHEDLRAAALPSLSRCNETWGSLRPEVEHRPQWIVSYSRRVIQIL